MKDIASNISVYRQTTARAVIRIGNGQLFDNIKNHSLPKGDILEIARTAGMLAAKQTGNVIPNSHNVPIDNVDINFTLIDQEIHCEATVSTVYKTGVGIEAIYAASVTAVTLFDLLKSTDDSLEIVSIKILEKKGGKSQFSEKLREGLSAAILVCSDAILKGQKENKSGNIVRDKLKRCNLSVADLEVLPNDEDTIRNKILEISPKVNLLIIAGGTGILEKDNTPEVVRPLFDKEVPGISEAARNYGQDRTPYAMLSRGIAGTIGKSLVLVIPGSSRGAEETMDALFPYVLHVFKFQKL